MRMSVVLLAMAVLATLNGCGQTFDAKDLAGTYEGVYSDGVDVLTLKADGGYDQLFKYNDGKQLSNNGMWKFSTAAGNKIDLHDVLTLHDLGADPIHAPQKGIWIMQVSRELFTGRLSLYVSEK